MYKLQLQHSEKSTNPITPAQALMMKIINLLILGWLVKRAMSTPVVPICSDFASDYAACGGEATLACQDFVSPTSCTCDSKYRMSSLNTIDLTVCAEWPATILTTAIDEYGLMRFNDHEKNDILQANPLDPKFDTIIIDAFSNISELVVTAGNVDLLKRSPEIVCGPTAVSMEVVYYQLNGADTGFSGPLTYDNWNENFLSPWQQGPRLGNSVVHLFGPQGTAAAADSWLGFVRCGCEDVDTGEIFFTHRDRIAQSNFTCRNYIPAVYTEVQLEGDRITDLAGPTARDAMALIPETALPFVDSNNVESKDLGANILWADCQRNIRVRKNAATEHEPTCEWIKNIYDLKILDEIGIVDTWCGWFQDGDECLVASESCGPGTEHAVAICPYSPVQIRENGMFFSDLNCSVTCKCRGEDMKTGTQQCDSIKRPCRDNEVDLLCGRGVCGNTPNHPCKTCALLENVLQPELLTLNPGTCSAPTDFEWIDPDGCPVKLPFVNCTVGIASPGCPVDEVLAHVCGPFASGCIRECKGDDCKSKCVCENDLRTYYPDLNSPDDNLRYTSEHACANWPQTISSVTFHNGGPIDVYEINSTFQFATPSDLDGQSGFEDAMLSALDDAGLPVDLDTFDNITLLCGERAYAWSVVDYRTSEELASTYFDWRYDTGPDNTGPALPQKALRLSDDVGVTHLTFLRCECLSDTMGDVTFSVWQDNAIQWHYQCDTWEPTIPPDSPDACPQVDQDTGTRVCNGVGECVDELPSGPECICPGHWSGGNCFVVSNTSSEGQYYTKSSCPTSGDNPLSCYFVDPCGDGCHFDHDLDGCACDLDTVEPVYLFADNAWARISTCWDGVVSTAMDGVNPCENEGECVLDPLSGRSFCQCVSPFSGRYCKSSECPGEVGLVTGTSCNNHGECTLNTTDDSYYCKCTAGWTGDDCSIPWCQDSCTNGQCLYRDEYSTPFCICADGFYGLTCENEFYAHQNCTGPSGTWDSRLIQCTCSAGMAGVHCDISELSNSTCNDVCSDHGRCSPSFLFGDRETSYSCKCQDSPGDDNITAPSHGIHCQKTNCPTGNDEVCSGKGVCIPGATCVCTGQAQPDIDDPNLWFIDIIPPVFNATDEVAFVQSAIGIERFGYACGDPLDACVDRPPPDRVAENRSWSANVICGGPDAGYCSTDPVECICFDGYSPAPFGSFDTCVADPQLISNVPCETGVFNYTSNQCECPEYAWSGPSCNISTCVAPLVPRIADQEWKCRCDDVTWDWKFECTEVNCTQTEPLCTHSTCWYTNDRQCTGWPYDIPIPFTADAFHEAGFNAEGVACNETSDVCICSDAVYKESLGYKCEPLWDMENVISLVATDPSNLSSTVITTCEYGWNSDGGFCNFMPCGDRGWPPTGDSPACPDGECCCNLGWQGTVCAESIPSAFCINEEIQYNNDCYCPGVYTTESACVTNQCSNTSTFVGGECVCDDDWGGELCNVSACWNGGYLNDVGCECYFPYSGDVCELTSTLAPTTATPTATVAPTSPPTTMRPTFPVPVVPTPTGDAGMVDIEKWIIILLMCIPFMLFSVSL